MTHLTEKNPRILCCDSNVRIQMLMISQETISTHGIGERVR